MLRSRPRAVSCLGDIGMPPQPWMSFLSILGKQAFALLPRQGSWQHSASSPTQGRRPSPPPPGPQMLPWLWSLPSALVQIPAAPFEASQHPLLPTSQDPEGSLLPRGPQHPAPSPWGPRTPILTRRRPEGLTLTATAGSGRSSRAGRETPHTGRYPWSRSSSADTFPLVVSRPPPRRLQPAAAAARPPLPCPLTPAKAPRLRLLSAHPAQWAGATTSAPPGDPPFRQLAHSVPASLLSRSLSLSFFLYPFDA